MKHAILGRDEYDRCTEVADENGILATAMEICNARELAALKLTANVRN
jgi:hypothetical protein